MCSSSSFESATRLIEIGFTTAGDDTGFGLDIVIRVVETHDWGLEATTSETGGARFELTNVARSGDAD